MEDNKTILIVEDEPETLKGYVSFLTPQSTAPARKSSRSAPAVATSPSPGALSETYTILQAPSGEKAVELVKAEIAAGRAVAAGFFDVKLGTGMDGLATIQAIQKLDPRIHCVVVTAYHDRSVEDIHQLFGEAFKDQWDYLNKPFTQGEIVQKARQMISAWNRKRQLEAMHDQIIRSERMAAIGQLARGIGHEFGNILLRIIGKSDLALMEDDVTKIKSHLEVVIQAAERAGVITRNLQSFSRSEPQLKQVVVIEPIDQALSLMNHEFTKSSVQVEKNYKSTPTIKMDRGGMGQVLLNILINAVHAMPSGGKIKITVEETPLDGMPGVVIRVADTGSGIPPEVLPRIFDYAFTTKGDSGSGLGLAISREIVTSHGGKIDVKTEIDKGTEFTLWLPSAKTTTS